MRTLIILVVFAFWNCAALAQPFPDFQSTTVNDYANLLHAVDEAELSARLTQLRQDTGIEMTVLTLATQTNYTSEQSLEQFATGVFNHWGIGLSNRNDGILVMVIRDDRAMRIELGSAYGRDWDRVASGIVDDHFLNSFRAGQYSLGIMEGSAAIIQDIALRFRAEGGSRGAANVNSIAPWFMGGFMVIVALIMGKQFVSDGLTRLRTCPNCGQRTLRQSRRILMPSSTMNAGHGIRRVRCMNCDYDYQSTYPIAQISQNSSGGFGGGFGGGSSGGGGASGRW